MSFLEISPLRVCCYEPVSVNIENPATVSKFSVSSYFAQINPLVSYFPKHN